MPSADANDDRLLALMPPVLADIARMIGVAAALKLAEAYGGTRPYIPAQESIGPDHPLAQAIGHAAAMQLANEYAGERPDIPLAAGWRRAVRNAAILHARRSGTPQPAVARQYGMTERNVRLIERRCELDGDDDQLGLF